MALNFATHAQANNLHYEFLIAADGRVYERSAIEKHFKGNLEVFFVKSPMTNEPLKHLDLLDATQHRNTIEVLIETKVITGELAERWIQRGNAKAELLKKADKGDFDSISTVLGNLLNGHGDFRQNDEEAFKLATKYHEAGSVAGTFALGRMNLHGWGMQRDKQKGIKYLTLAAKECDHVAFHFALALAKGKFGLEKDLKGAIRHLEHSISGNCAVQIMKNTQKARAKNILAELRQRLDDG
ncbi:MAG: hypothetical protein SGARI_007395 [Bacillariaceae sp.]